MNRRSFFRIMGIGGIIALLSPLSFISNPKVVGKITDVKTYKKALSEESIKALYEESIIVKLNKDWMRRITATGRTI